MRRMVTALAIVATLMIQGPLPMSAALNVPAILVNPFPGECPSGPGCLDTSFGSSGLAFVDVGGTYQTVMATAVQPDGKILVAGYSTYVSAPLDRSWVVTRFESDGQSIDTTFGNNGVILVDFLASGNNLEQARAIAVQPDGHIVVAGSGSGSLPSGGITGYTAVLRFDEDGIPDSTFGAGGTVRFNNTSGTVYVGWMMKIQTDGKIVFVSSGAGLGSTVTRLKSTGAMDTTFGSKGSRAIAAPFMATSLAMQSNGSIVVGGVDTTKSDFAVYRLTSAGAVDSKFGTSGKTTVDFGPYDFARSIAVAPDDSIVVAGYTGSSATSSETLNMALARLTANGALSTSFGTMGKVVLDIHGGLDSANALAIQPDGKIAFAGSARESATSPNAFGIVGRLLATGALDTTFGAPSSSDSACGVSQTGTPGAFNGLAIAADGGILAVGQSFPPGSTGYPWIVGKYSK